MAASQPQSNSILDELKDIQRSCVSAEHEFAESIAAACTQSKESIRNLLHYLAFRKHDLRDLQSKLAAMGLSSLGRLESDTVAGLNAVIAALEALTDGRASRISQTSGFESGPAKLREHAECLLGPVPKGRAVRVMVTMPTKAAYSYDFVKELISAGTDVVRINCAHDSEEEWAAMVETSEAPIGSLVEIARC